MSCNTAQLLPYDKMMACVKSIDIGWIGSVTEYFCHDFDDEEKVDRCYRSLTQFLPMLAEFNLRVAQEDLLWFNNEVNTFHVVLGGEGTGPFWEGQHRMFSPSKCSLLSTAARSSSTKMVFRPCLKMTCTPASMAVIYCSQPRCHSNTSGSPPPRNCCPVLPTLVPSRSEVISSRPQSVLPEDVHSPPSAVTPVAGLNPSDISYRYAPAHMDHKSLDTTGFLRLLRLPPPRPAGDVSESRLYQLGLDFADQISFSTTLIVIPSSSMSPSSLTMQILLQPTSTRRSTTTQTTSAIGLVPMSLLSLSTFPV